MCVVVDNCNLTVFSQREGRQREDHPVVARVAALQLSGRAQAWGADGRGGLPLPVRRGGVSWRPDVPPACVGRWGGTCDVWPAGGWGVEACWERTGSARGDWI